MLADRALLVAVIAAHQHTDLVVMVQAREGQLMAKTLLLERSFSSRAIRRRGRTISRLMHR